MGLIIVKKGPYKICFSRRLLMKNSIKKLLTISMLFTSALSLSMEQRRRVAAPATAADRTPVAEVNRRVAGVISAEDQQLLNQLDAVAKAIQSPLDIEIQNKLATVQAVLKLKKTSRDLTPEERDAQLNRLQTLLASIDALIDKCPNEFREYVWNSQNVADLKSARIDVARAARNLTDNWTVFNWYIPAVAYKWGKAALLTAGAALAGYQIFKRYNA